eukprot:1222028-Pleurochrysis_carterae.AAC.1
MGVLCLPVPDSVLEKGRLYHSIVRATHGESIEMASRIWPAMTEEDLPVAALSSANRERRPWTVAGS